jgi:hydrogenase/urease accessory protein HupE
MNLLGRLIFLALLLPSAAWAHKFAPSLLSVVESAPNSYAVTFKTPVQTITRTLMKPTWPDGCSPVVIEKPIRVGTGIITQWRLTCNPPASNLAGKSFGVSGLAPNRANAIFTLTLIDGTDFQAMLNVNHPTYLIRAPRSTGDVFLDYLVLGVRHIWGGLDHLLFVFGLLLLIAGPRRLLWTITAFTLGHSVTLALATLGVIQYPVDLIEVLIAISVFTLAVTLTSKNQERLLWRSPGWLAAGFGLLHGMGFAGALLEIGLPSKNLLLALFSFNAGIEVGQILFIVAFLLPWHYLKKRSSRRFGVARWASIYLLGSLAAYWTVERSVIAFG